MVIRLLVSALLAYIVMGVATLFVVTDVNGRPHKKQIENRGPLVLPSAAYRRSHKNYLRRAGAAGTIASIIVVVGFLIISHPSTTTGAKYALGHEKVNKITVTWQAPSGAALLHYKLSQGHTTCNVLAKAAGTYSCSLKVRAGYNYQISLTACVPVETHQARLKKTNLSLCSPVGSAGHYR
jgi:hypothetical protein